jgi:hypothetical protein
MIGGIEQYIKMPPLAIDLFCGLGGWTEGFMAEGYQDGAAQYGSRSNSRKAASAMIAKIPFPLALHIAQSFKPRCL